MREALTKNEQGKIIYLSFPQWEHRGDLGHGFSTRQGGVSSGPFESLNLGFKGGDDPLAVARNRSLFLSVWGKEENQLVSGEQIHGANVFVVDHDYLNSGSRVVPSTDAFVTAEKKVLLGAYSADCQLVLFFDPFGPVIGIAHAGWRGTLQGIVASVVEVMESNYNSNRHHLQCLFGPCIKPCCFEIGEEVENGAAATSWSAQVVFLPGPKRQHLDLTATNRNILTAAGVQESHIYASQLCTCCKPGLFYSYRRSKGGPTGSMMGIIYLA